MLVPLTAIVTSSLPMAAAIAFCAKDRSTVHAKKNAKSGKSTKSARSGKSSKSRRSSSKSRRSGASQRSKSRRSGKSKRSGKSGKSGKAAGKTVSGSEKSEKSEKDKKNKSSRSKRSSSSKKDKKKKSDVTATLSTVGSDVSAKSSRRSKSSKSRRRLAEDAQKKMEKSGKVAAVPVVPKKEMQNNSSAEKSLKDEVAAIKHSTSLAVVPARLQYPTLGGVSTIEIKNNSAERKAIKVKCSDNVLYRVNPVHGFAEPHSSVKVDVLRLNGEEKTDKLVVLVANAKNSADPREVFAGGSAEPREMMVVPLVSA